MKRATSPSTATSAGWMRPFRNWMAVELYMAGLAVLTRLGDGREKGRAASDDYRQPVKGWIGQAIFVEKGVEAVEVAFVGQLIAGDIVGDRGLCLQWPKTVS